jgi:hypothetical protein
MIYLKLYEEFTTELNIKKIMDSYLECAIWTEEERLEEENTEGYEGEIKDLIPEADLNIHNFSDDSKIKAYEDIKLFLKYAGDSVDGIDEEQLGHDIWLSRNLHGAGFFDRGYDDDIEKRLMDSAHKIGGVDIYLGDDGLLYFGNE